MRKQKLTRKSLDELAKIMPVLSEEEQRECIGRYGRVVRGTGTAEDPKIIQEVFNVPAWAFGENKEMFTNTISSAVSEFNDQGIQKVNEEYFKLVFVCNILSTPDDYERIHTWQDTLIGGSSRERTSNDPETEGALTLGERDPNGTSGIMTYYKNIEKTFGSGAACLDEMKKVIIHEIGHSFGLEHGDSSIMDRFYLVTGSFPSDIESGAIIKMIENNPK